MFSEPSEVTVPIGPADGDSPGDTAAEVTVRLAPEDIAALAEAIAQTPRRIAREDIAALAAAIVKNLHEKFRSPNFQFDVLQRLPYSQDSADYVSAHMGSAMKVPGKVNHLKHALEHIDGDGLVLEFGVFKGQSINVIAEVLGEREVHGFDSFEGLPENWAGYNVTADAFDQQGNMPKVRENVTLHRGWFSHTITPFLERAPGSIAFLHIDCDLYSSTRDVFDGLAGRIRPGTVIVFDEYHNFPYWREHEHKAFQEFCAAHNVTYQYISYNNLQAATRIESIDSPRG